jgi:hypothetical protein
MPSGSDQASPVLEIALLPTTSILSLVKLESSSASRAATTFSEGQSGLFLACEPPLNGSLAAQRLKRTPIAFVDGKQGVRSRR